MKKIFFALFALPVALAGLFAAAPVYAVDIVQGACEGGPANNTAICEAGNANQGTIVGKNGILTKVVQTFAYIAGIIAVIMVILGGFKYITANGDSGSIASAKQTIIYALVGVVIAILAQAIVSYILSKL